MAIFLRVHKCLKGHPLWIRPRDNYQYFCEICGDIDIQELRKIIYRKIKRLRPTWLTRKIRATGD